MQVATEQGQARDAESPLDIRGLTVTYGEKPAVFSVDARFAPGVMTAIVGPNGAGKSTLLKAALGIVRPVSGQVKAWGRPIAAGRARISYVPQRASVDWDFPDARDRRGADGAIPAAWAFAARAHPAYGSGF